jgi:hypothetical protein
VLVSIDTLRADAVFPEQGPALMPSLSRRAREHGQVVTHHYAASTWTLPSHASMLTGRYPSGHGADNGLPADVRGGGLVPEKLARAGWFTVGIVGGGFVSRSFGLDAGFQVFLEAVDTEDDGYVLRMLDSLEPQLRRRPTFLLIHTYLLHNYFMDAPEMPGRPSLPDLGPLAYALAHNRDAARPREDPEVAALARELYARRAKRTDTWLAALLDSLDRRFGSAPPLVLVTSDHGEAFGEGPAGRSWSHGGTPDESVARVPLIVFHPDRRPRPDLTALTSGVDLAPTILAWAGVDADGSHVGQPLGSSRRRLHGGVYSETSNGLETWALLGEAGKVVHSGLDAARRTEWVPGRPGAYDEGAAVPAAPPVLARANAARRASLTELVDGLFLEGLNEGGQECEVTAELRFDAPEPSLERLLAGGLRRFSSYLLEADDVAVMAGAREARVRLSLRPGDVDLLIVKEPGDLGISVGPGAARVSLGGVPAEGRDLRAGRLLTPPLAGPPASERGCAFRVWENRPPGVTVRMANTRARVPDDALERLRALGYVR